MFAVYLLVVLAFVLIFLVDIVDLYLVDWLFVACILLCPACFDVLLVL